MKGDATQRLLEAVRAFVATADPLRLGPTAEFAELVNALKELEPKPQKILCLVRMPADLEARKIIEACDSLVIANLPGSNVWRVVKDWSNLARDPMVGSTVVRKEFDDAVARMLVEDVAS